MHAHTQSPLPIQPDLDDNEARYLGLDATDDGTLQFGALANKVHNERVHHPTLAQQTLLIRACARMPGMRTPTPWCLPMLQGTREFAGVQRTLR